MPERIPGFDAARAYAIFGMFIVNFNFCFGFFNDPTPTGRFLRLFTGNSTSIFIILAGMGVSLMANRYADGPEAQARAKSIVLRRSWFLLAMGLLLYPWWPGDILHFYGGYMHIAAFMLFVPKRYYLWAALGAILVFHALLFVIPVETSWNFDTSQYADFWTPLGFLRNTLYNGWNSIFPWFAYFAVGMWLGRMDWRSDANKSKVFLAGFVLFSLFQGVRLLAKYHILNEYWTYYTMSEYFPPFLPFMMITAGFALMVIPVFMFLGEQFSDSKIMQWLAQTGRMTLTHYVMHITVGMLVFAAMTGKHYTGLYEDEMPTPPGYILAFSVCYFLCSVAFSVIWGKWFSNGPLESVMRKLSA